MSPQRVEVIWFPQGWAPTTLSINPSIAAAERAAHVVAQSERLPGKVLLRIWYGPGAGERLLYTLEDKR